MINRRLADFILIGVLLVLAVLLYRSTAGFPAFAQKTTANYVRFLGVALGVLCLIQLVISARSRNPQFSQQLQWMDNPGRFWGLFILMVIFALLLDVLGFFVASILFLPTAMLMLGNRRKTAIVFTTTAVLLFIFLVFVKLLGVHLPTGVWF